MPVAHLGHVELSVTDLDRSRWFFEEVLGLFVTEDAGERVYLRAWQDWDHHTLVLREAPESAVDHVAWRVDSSDALADFEAKLGRAGTEHDWAEGTVGHGDALRFRSPAGLPLELYWEVERYLDPPAELASTLPSHPSRYVGRGVAPRRFDHVNFLVDDVAAEQRYFTDQLEIHHRYFVEGNDGLRLGSWLSRTNISHELALMRNAQQTGGALHHIAYFMNSVDEMARAATILAENGIPIEWGPGCHGTSGAVFLYCFEPSGHRVEVWTGGMLIFAPDWEPLRWNPEVSQHALELWGSTMPDSYLRRGTALRATVTGASA